MKKIKFKDSGFCRTLEKSYEASNGKLITEDYVKSLFIKEETSRDELHDLWTWNTAAHLDLHAFMIEERRIASSKIRWLWYCAQHSVHSIIGPLWRLIRDRTSKLPVQLLFILWILLPVLMSVDQSSVGLNPLVWQLEDPIGLFVGVTLFYILPISYPLLKSFTAGGTGIMQSSLGHGDNDGAFRPWFGKDRNGDGWVDGRIIEFVNPKFNKYIKNMYSYTSGSFEPLFTADLPLGWLVDSNSNHWGEPIEGAHSMEDYWRLRSGEVDDSLGVPTFWGTIHEFLKNHDLRYLKDLDNYPFYATLEDSIAFHEHYLNHKLREFEAFLKYRGTKEYHTMWLSYGPNDGAFMSQTFNEFFFSTSSYGRPTFDPKPGYEGRRSNKKNNVARYLDWLPDNDVKLAARAIGINTSMKDIESVKKDILKLEVRNSDSSLSSLDWKGHHLYWNLLPWHQRNLFQLIKGLMKTLAQIGIIHLAFVVPLLIYINRPYIYRDPIYHWDSLVLSYCAALFVIKYLYGRFLGPVDHQAEYIKIFLK